MRTTGKEVVKSATLIYIVASLSNYFKLLDYCVFLHCRCLNGVRLSISILAIEWKWKFWFLCNLPIPLNSPFSLFWLWHLETRINIKFSNPDHSCQRLKKNKIENFMNFREVIKLFFFICLLFFQKEDGSNHMKMRRARSINFIDQNRELISE